MYSILISSLLTFHLVMKADMKLGPDRDTAPSFAITNGKNAITHLSDVHRIGRDGQLPEETAEEEHMRQAFGKAVPRVSFSRTVFRQMLIRWVTPETFQSEVSRTTHFVNYWVISPPV